MQPPHPRQGGPATPPLIIVFASPSSLLREPDRASMLPIVRNGPPGTFVVFPGGLRVSLPTDQIVSSHDTDGHVVVGFGGMQYIGVAHGRLTFVRVRELLPEEQLSPARSHTMRLDPAWVTMVAVDGQPVYGSR